MAPGPIPGALRFVSLALHIPSHKGEGHRRYVSARNASEPYFHPETRFSKARPLLSLHTRSQKSRGTQQAWMNSRNQTTIARGRKHRQLVFLHHRGRIGTNAGRPCTSEVLRRINHGSGFRQEAAARQERVLTPPKCLNLPIPATASTLQVFQIIYRAGMNLCRVRSGAVSTRA